MRSLFVTICALPILAGHAFGWGCDGHQMMALIARAHLTPAASAAVDKLFADSPLAPAHRNYCQDQPTDLMADAAPWADDIKNQDKTFLWHQIDIPLQTEGGDYRKWCEPIGPSVDGKDRPGCVINAIEFELDTVRNRTLAAPERAKALRMLIHLMGDLSQPLHISDNKDQGGNCTSFELPFLDKPTTLHGIWDFDLITQELKSKHMTEMALASVIDDEYKANWAQWGSGRIDVEAWAWEAHKAAASTVYGMLNPKIPLAAEDGPFPTRAACDAKRKSVADMHIPITADYQERALQLIHQQIAKAGYRLALVLNETFR